MEDIVHELSVKAPPSEAYQAVAAQDGIRAWWSSRADVGDSVGSGVTLRFPYEGQEVVMQFEVTALEPNRRVQWTCTENANPVWPGSTIDWTFGPDGDGSTVRLVHAGFSAGGPPYEFTIEGWKPYVASLDAYLNGAKGSPAA